MLWNFSVCRHAHRPDSVLASGLCWEPMADLPDIRRCCSDHQYVVSRSSLAHLMKLTCRTHHQGSPVFLAPSKVSWTVRVTLFMSLFGCVLVLIVTCAMHQSTQPGIFLTRSDLGTSGWSPGMAWVLGIANAMYAFGGTDGGKLLSDQS